MNKDDRYTAYITGVKFGYSLAIDTITHALTQGLEVMIAVEKAEKASKGDFEKFKLLLEEMDKEFRNKRSV